MFHLSKKLNPLPLLALTMAIGPISDASAVEVRFLVERVSEDLGKVVLENDGVRSEPFDLPVNNLSRPQEPPARTFSIRSVEKNESMATVELPEEGESFVALLLVSAEGGYTPVLMPSENPKFKGGDVHIYNNTNKRILGHIGSSEFTIDPNESSIVTPGGTRDAQFFHVAADAEDETEKRLFKSNRWPENNKVRYYLFVFTDPKTKRITCRGVDEFLISDND